MIREIKDITTGYEEIRKGLHFHYSKPETFGKKLGPAVFDSFETIKKKYSETKEFLEGTIYLLKTEIGVINQKEINISKEDYDTYNFLVNLEKEQSGTVIFICLYFKDRGVEVSLNEGDKNICKKNLQSIKEGMTSIHIQPGNQTSNRQTPSFRNIGEKVIAQSKVINSFKKTIQNRKEKNNKKEIITQAISALNEKDLIKFRKYKAKLGNFFNISNKEINKVDYGFEPSDEDLEFVKRKLQEKLETMSGGKKTRKNEKSKNTRKNKKSKNSRKAKKSKKSRKN